MRSRKDTNMKIIHIAFFAVLVLSLIGCSSGSSGAAPSTDTNKSDLFINIDGYDAREFYFDYNEEVTIEMTVGNYGPDTAKNVVITALYTELDETQNTETSQSISIDAETETTFTDEQGILQPGVYSVVYTISTTSNEQDPSDNSLSVTVTVGESDIKTSGGVEFNITTSIAGVPDAWKTGDGTVYNGYGNHAISTLSISKDDSYDGGFYSVNGIPCILETLIITTISTSVYTQNYLAEGTDGVLYNLRIDDDVLETAHIVFPDDGLGAQWDNVELDGSTTSYEIVGLGDEPEPTYTPNSDQLSAVTTLQYNFDAGGAQYTYYNTDIIPIEITFYGLTAMPTGYFVAQWADLDASIIAPAGNN